MQVENRVDSQTLKKKYVYLVKVIKIKDAAL